MRLATILVLCSTLAAQSPQEAPEDPLLSAVAAVVADIVEDPGGLGERLAPGFIKAVPPSRLAEIFSAMAREHGEKPSWEVAERLAAFEAHLLLRFGDGATSKLWIKLEGEAPHRIAGLWFGPPEYVGEVPATVLEAMQGLPGEVSVAVLRLGAEPELVCSHQPDRALAIGSSFKLYVLGALLGEIAAGRCAWDEVVALDAARASLPSGVLQDWPEGAPLTVHTLATQMISISDNTASDLLLWHLGRERVEGALEPMGCAAALRNRPFLSTRELFLLKGVAGEALRGRFAEADEAARRRLLAEELAALSLDDFVQWDRPLEVQRLEWFASARDLCRAMDALRARALEEEALEPVLGVLAVNPGLGTLVEDWDYLGYKGGSEPGVLNLSFLLRQGDAWWAASFGWNDPGQPLDEERFFQLVARLLRALAR